MLNFDATASARARAGSQTATRLAPSICLPPNKSEWRLAIRPHPSRPNLIIELPLRQEPQGGRPAGTDVDPRSILRIAPVNQGDLTAPPQIGGPVRRAAPGDVGAFRTKPGKAVGKPVVWLPRLGYPAPRTATRMTDGCRPPAHTNTVCADLAHF